MSENTDLTIGGLSAGTGVKVETIRYYERIGLLPVPMRNAGGRRLYGAEDLKRLTFIRRSRELGFALSEARELLGLLDRGYTCAQVKALTVGHLQDVRDKIVDLQRLERSLADLAERCDGGDLSDCPIIDALSG